jgi:hypothetical protein
LFTLLMAVWYTLAVPYPVTAPDDTGAKGVPHQQTVMVDGHKHAETYR